MPTPQHTAQPKNRTKIIALLLILGPTLLIVSAFALFALTNLVLNPTFWPTPDSELVAPTPLGITIVNVTLFIMGSTGVIAWLPGIIIGVVLLSKAAKKH